jgi:anti-sigma B factor antagonist
MPENPSASPPDGLLQAEVVRDGETATLSLTGELDLAVVDLAREKLAEAREGNPTHVVVDLSGLTFIDSTGIAFLVAAANGDGEHRLTFIPCEVYAVQRVLSVTGVAELLDGATTETSQALEE